MYSLVLFLRFWYFFEEKKIFEVRKFSFETREKWRNNVSKPLFHIILLEKNKLFIISLRNI